MQDMMARLVDVPMARMFVLTGIIFLLVAVLGKIEGKIEPGNIGRIGASIVGTLLMAGGLAMYFLEGDMIRGRLAANLPPMATEARAVPGKGGVRQQSAAAAADPPAIQVVAATYGRSCGAKPGNATPILSRACDGRAVCDYRIDVSGLEDTAPNCDKDYVAEWKCGGGSTVYTISVAAGGARGEHLRLACSGG